ncbi:hypothetical protein PHMEG_00037501, partial [Phytophthora megakarya]
MTERARKVSADSSNPRVVGKSTLSFVGVFTKDPVSELVNSSIGDMFTNWEPDESSLVPVFDRRSFVDDICFGSETFDTLYRLLQRFTECRISVSFTKSIFVQSRVDFLSHEVIPDGLRAGAKKKKRVTEFSFPTSKKGVQSFLGALNYYSRFIQDLAVCAAALYQLKEEDFEPGDDLSAARQRFARLQQKIGDAPILRHFDQQKDIHVTLFANEWALSSTVMQEHDGKMHPMNYHPAKKEVLALLLLRTTCYTQLGPHHSCVHTIFNIEVGTHIEVSVRTYDPIRCDAVSVTPGSHQGQRKGLRFRPALVSWTNEFYSLTTVTPPTKGSSTVRMDPQLLYARLPQSYSGLVVSFDGSAKTEKYGGYGSCSWIVWRLPDWTIVTAASAYLEATTVNMAEYSGMNNGVQAALDIGATDLVIQSLGVIACKKESLMTQLNRHREVVARLKSVKYLYAVREYNASAD